GVARQRLLESIPDLAAVALLVHVDEVDHDDAADVAQPELAGDLLAGLEVVGGDRVLEVARAGVGEAAGVDVDRGQRLALVDHQGPAALERDPAGDRGPELRLDVELGGDRPAALLLPGPLREPPPEHHAYP